VDETIGTGRLEAFSDGVFAIAITLLILEIRVSGPLGNQLLHIWPSYLAYVTSFLTIGIIWLNHHLIFVKVRAVDRTLLLINTLFLMVVAFIPFPTFLVAEYLRESGEREAVLALGITFVVLAILFQMLWLYVALGRRLIRDDVPQTAVDDITRTYLPGVPVYAVATLVALVSPLASIALLLAIAVFYSLPPSWLRR
jgi:TMEM175 potassium channel family protein